MRRHLSLISNHNGRESVMLILTRQKEEPVIINGNIKSLGYVLGGVKLGFELSSNSEVVREELLLEIAD